MKDGTLILRSFCKKGAPGKNMRWNEIFLNIFYWPSGIFIETNFQFSYSNLVMLLYFDKKGIATTRNSIYRFERTHNCSLLLYFFIRRESNDHYIWDIKRKYSKTDFSLRTKKFDTKLSLIMLGFMKNNWNASVIIF